MKKIINHKSLFIILFLFAFLERTVFDLGPNIELLTSVMVLSAFAFGGKMTFWLTLAVIAFSDLIIGNSKIFLFTWSGFLIPSLVLPKLFRYLKFGIRNSRWKVILLSGTGVVSNLFFYAYTNFGVWLLDTWGMYTKDLAGLFRCYINGLPFLKNQVISSLIFIPLGYFAVSYSQRLLEKINFSKNFKFASKIPTKS